MTPLVCPHCRTECAPPPGYAGQSLVCPICGQLIKSAAPLAVPVAASYDSPEVPLAGPAAPPVYADDGIPDAELVEAPASPIADPAAFAPSESPWQIGWLLALLLLVASGIFLMACITVGYVVIARGRVQPGDSNGADAPLQVEEEMPGDGHWTAAQTTSYRLGAARVKVVSVRIDAALGEGLAGGGMNSGGDFLEVLLRIDNRGSQPLNYRSWYGNDFTALRDGQRISLRARLRDDAGRAYSWAIFDDVATRVRWHTPAATIAPKKSTVDAIVFQLPAGAARQNLRYLRLELPAAAIDHGEGYYRFEIPRKMIEGL